MSTKVKFGYVKNTGHRFKVTGNCFTNKKTTLTIYKINANIRPKNFCLGLTRPKVSFNECSGYFLYW